MQSETTENEIQDKIGLYSDQKWDNSRESAIRNIQSESNIHKKHNCGIERGTNQEELCPKIRLCPRAIYEPAWIF